MAQSATDCPHVFVHRSRKPWWGLGLISKEYLTCGACHHVVVVTSWLA